MLFFTDRNQQGDNVERNDNNNNQRGFGKDREDMTKSKPTDYNDIIKDYISKFLEPKPAPSKQSTQKINPNSIKMFNVPMKNMLNPNNAKNVKSDGEKPKFKIIKEFRVTLDDLKKLKLAPFVLPNGGHNKPNGSPPHFGSNGRNMFNNNNNNSFRPNRFEPNFSVPFSASSFKPLAYQDFKSNKSNIYNSPKRMGDAPLPRHLNSSPRNNNAFSRRRLQTEQSPKPSLKGISPPNMMFSQQSSNLDRLAQVFRRSAEDQAFFESKRLRA